MRNTGISSAAGPDEPIARSVCPVPAQPITAGRPVNFKDHFSARAALYATYRPVYPASLFSHLATLPSSVRVACDCATGSGQAARGLIGHFNRVIAVDASQSQLSHAARSESVSYVAAEAEGLPLIAGSVDIVTVAQALHWLNLEEFYGEVRRVLAPRGIIAVWGYGDPILNDSKVHEAVHRFNRGTVERYWAPERTILLDGYATIPFPFLEVPQPTFVLSCDWTLADLCGYLRTWSATAAYVAEHDVDPVIELEAELATMWGPPDARKTLRWPLFLRAGYA